MPRCRQFKLIDAMILVVVAALAMAEIRPGWTQFHAFLAGIKMVPTREAYSRMVQSSLTIALINLAVAYGWIRLIPPRLPRSDQIRQPGMLSIILLIGIALIFLPLSAFVPMGAPTQLVFALTLGLSWAAASWRYRSHAEAGWIEILGRFLAVGLIVAIAASYS